MEYFLHVGTYALRDLANGISEQAISCFRLAGFEIAGCCCLWTKPLVYHLHTHCGQQFQRSGSEARVQTVFRLYTK